MPKARYRSSAGLRSVDRHHLLKGLLALGEDFVRAPAEALVQAAEMTEAMGAAAKGERSGTRLSHYSGYNSRSLIIRVGMLRLRVPQDRTHRCVRPDILDLPAKAKADCRLRDPATEASIGPPRSKRSCHHNARGP
jgi:mutator family transposase